MQTRSRTQDSSWRQLSWGLALALALLFSQFAGQRHRIDHTLWLTDAALQQGPGAINSLAAEGYVDATHSCIALDGASLAAGLATALPAFAPLPCSTPAPALQADSLWDAPFMAHFRSRAPPVFL